ncbi:MAG: hypothetical protein Q4G70_06575 [Pseudomonadota bacterium]|nr:hypothetical protein [Pseudomonadota bacterium]
MVANADLQVIRRGAGPAGATGRCHVSANADARTAPVPCPRGPDG